MKTYSAKALITAATLIGANAAMGLPNVYVPLGAAHRRHRPPDGGGRALDQVPGIDPEDM